MNQSRTYAESGELAELAEDFPAAVDDATAIDAPKSADLILEALLQVSRETDDALTDTRTSNDARLAWQTLREVRRVLARTIPDVVLAGRLLRSVQ